MYSTLKRSGDGPFYVGLIWNTRDVVVGNMPEYGLSITHILPYTNRIADYVPILEGTGQRDPYPGIFYAICSTKDVHLKMFI